MRRLCEQLRKRHVFRTLLTYLALSWVLLQVVSLVASIIGLPDGTVRILARGDFDAVVDFLEDVDVGKPILYGNIRHDAVFS